MPEAEVELGKRCGAVIASHSVPWIAALCSSLRYLQHYPTRFCNGPQSCATSPVHNVNRVTHLFRHGNTVHNAITIDSSPDAQLNVSDMEV
jgi:hypothetical protein